MNQFFLLVQTSLPTFEIQWQTTTILASSILPITLVTGREAFVKTEYLNRLT
jgi:hypothetical protein